jgi:hypothetical protein
MPIAKLFSGVRSRFAIKKNVKAITGAIQSKSDTVYSGKFMIVSPSLF